MTVRRALAVGVGCALALPATAGAGTVSKPSTSMLRFTAAYGEENLMAIDKLADGSLLIKDNFPVTLAAGTGCTLDSYDDAHCPATGITKVEVLAGSDDDTVSASSTFPIPVYLNGGDGFDVLTGGAAADRIDGGPGIGNLSGGAGDDSVIGRNQRDWLYGGPGNDHLYGYAEVDTMSGDAGNDVLQGSYGADVENGGDGDDTVTGGDDGDSLSGGPGVDKLYGQAGNDSLAGDDGNDRLDGGTGTDTAGGGAGSDTLLGGDDNDMLLGGFDADDLRGGNGVDSVDYRAEGGSRVRVDVTLDDFPNDGESGSTTDHQHDGPVGARDNVRTDVERVVGTLGPDFFKVSGVPGGQTTFDGGGGDDFFDLMDGDILDVALCNGDGTARGDQDSSRQTDTASGCASSRFYLIQ